MAAQKEGSSCQRTVARSAEGHSCCVPRLKLLAVVRIVEQIQDTAAGCNRSLINAFDNSFK
jgi:hypothetical protein